MKDGASDLTDLRTEPIDLKELGTVLSCCPISDDYIERIIAELRTLRAENAELKSREGCIGCLGCWRQFLASDEGRNELIEHVMTCPTHPFYMSLEFITGEMAHGVGDRIDKLEAENAELRKK